MNNTNPVAINHSAPFLLSRVDRDLRKVQFRYNRTEIAITAITITSHAPAPEKRYNTKATRGKLTPY